MSKQDPGLSIETKPIENASTRSFLELMYHISRELAAALDLPSVLHRVLTLSMESIGATNGSLIVLDDNQNPVDSAIIVGERVHEHTTDQLSVTFERGLAGWVARNREAVLIPDTSRDERWLQRPDDAADQTGAKSAVSMPILARDHLVGVMTLVHPAPGFFTQDHFELLQAIVDQAGIAILNARLYEESLRQARVMTAVAESAAVITATLKLEDVLERILEQISQALRVEAASLALVSANGEEIEFCASTQTGGSQAIAGRRLKLGQGIAGWVAQEGRGIIVPSVYDDPRFHADFDRELGFETHAIACAPIRSEDAVIGVIEAINPLSGRFDEDALLVLTGVGSLAGTAIRHAQLFEQLQAAHQRFRELFEDSIDPILLTDWKGHIQEANRQAKVTTGYKSEALLGRNIANLHKVDEDVVGPGFSQLESGDTYAYESILRGKGVRSIPVQVHVRRVYINGASFLQWILRDISERKDLDNLRDDLISMIYHDLRSPLANIVSSLDVLASMLPLNDEPNLRSLLNIAVRSTERIQRLTNSLLDINRLEAGQPIGNRQPADPLPLIQDAVEAVLPIAHNKQQDLLLEVESGLPYIIVDADMIRRVLVNLIENAVKFSPPGGKVWIGAQAAGEFVQMWVRDTGPGIPADEQGRIFDKFTRLHAKDGPKGLGLGLAYCRLAVQGHGGRIWVEDAAPQGGSVFCFALPRVNPAAGDPTAPL